MFTINNAYMCRHMANFKFSRILNRPTWTNEWKGVHSLYYKYYNNYSLRELAPLINFHHLFWPKGPFWFVYLQFKQTSSTARAHSAGYTSISWNPRPSSIMHNVQSIQQFYKWELTIMEECFFWLSSRAFCRPIWKDFGACQRIQNITASVFNNS